MAYGTVNADVIGTSVAGSNLGAGNASIMKNRIINGAMVIDQRNAGASVTQSNVADVYPVDRFKINGSQNAKFTAQQNAGSVTPPVGFTNYLGITSSAATTVGASDYFLLTQNVEGFNAADLGWGSASAKTVTLSFQVYSSLTGTFGGCIANSAFNRSYPFAYSIPVANTWTTISITIAGDTSGTWLKTNGIGLNIQFGLGVGSTYSGTAGAWAGAGYISATGATSVVGTNGATFYITGVQLEVGSSATGFEYRQYGQELALCQRYFIKYAGNNPYEQVAQGWAAQTTNVVGVTTFPVTMRTTPSVSASTLQASDQINAGIAITGYSIDPNTSGTATVMTNFTVSGATQYRPYIARCNNSTSGYLSFSAEL